ncbi:pre-mRNA-processing protein 40A-like isoform X1 [Solanum tuberosum]|uniref:pre-mRNA-processing protein 40A-like isoform X1 n=1 Tax=Solanum tuberosum TaxID=4113 RepID=UPI00073A4C2E|nr:PREDICTED: pre-mRNA-processing protein 40A-like isoform X1 [Solanum tuberosum]
MANNSHFTGMQPPIPPLAGPPQGAIPSMSLQQFQPMLPPQQAQPYVSGSSQHFQPLGHANVVMPPQPSQIQFPQPMQQVAGRPVVGGHSMSQGPPNPHDFQRNPPMSNNHMPGSGGPSFPLSSSYNQVNADSSSSQYQTQIHDHRFPSGVQPWMPTSNHNVNSATTMQNTGELAAPLVLPEANNRVDSAETTPSDWIEHTSRNGKKYYYNRRTRISSWEKPLELMTEMERADASTDWREFTSPAGRKYYYNKVTRKSKWKMPDEVKLAREKDTISHASDFGSISSIKTSSPGADGSFVSAQGAMTSPIAVSPVANLPAIVASESSSLSGKVSSPTIDAVEMQNSSEPASPAVANSEKIGIAVTLGNSVTIPVSSETTSAQDAVACGNGVSPENREEVKQDAAITGIGSATPSEEKTVELGPLVYESKVEAKNAFKTLLESANIGSDCTWDQAMRAIINDRRYGALKSLGERKQAFNEYLSQRKKLEAEERRVKQKKAREDFRIMLEDCKELSPSSRWSKAISIFELDERFKAVERAKDREDLFEDYKEELEKKERARALEEQKRNRVEYLEFLKSCDFIKASSQWRKVQDRLEADERCPRLEKIDRLEIFQEYIRDLEREEEEQRKLRMEELRKAERKNRDEFRKLMEEHVAVGMLNAKTIWRDYCIKIKDIAAYLAVSSNTSGSSAKDLFADVVDELDKQYLDDKSRIRDAVRMTENGLTSTWTLDDFKDAIAKDISSPPISDTNLKLVFEELLERAREREEKEAKKRKRLADEFYELLHASKEITASSKWEDCKSLFGDRIMGDESLLLEIFDKFVNELKEKAKEKDRKRQEDKARKEKERKDREKKKEKHRRDKHRGDKSRKERERSKKDSTDSDKEIKRSGSDRDKRDSDKEIRRSGSDRDKKDSDKEIKRSGSDRDKKHRKRHRRSSDDDENEKDHSRSSYRRDSDYKKLKQMDQHSRSLEANSEGQHKKRKRDHRSDSHRDGDYEDHKDWEFGEDEEV